MEEHETLDDHFDYKEIIMEASMFPTILRYGVIGSVILVVLSIIQFSIGNQGMDDEISYVVEYYIISTGISFLTYIGSMTFAILNFKRINEGFASLGQAFGVTFLTGLFMAVVSLVFSIIMMLGFGFASFGMGDINEFNNAVGNEFTSVFLVIWTSITSLFFGCMVGAVIALIISVITKKERPLGFNT